MNPNFSAVLTARPSFETAPRINAGLVHSPRIRVIRQLEEWIRAGDLPSGQPVPSERALARQLGVDRGTVRSALSTMSEEGLLRSNGGRLKVVAVPGPETRQPAAKSGGGLLDHTVAVLTDPDEPVSDNPTGGWSSFLSHGALKAAREAGLHTLAIHPYAELEETVARLAEAQPIGVVIPDIWNKPGLTDEWALRLREAGVRVAVYGNSPAVWCLDRVVSDHEQGAYEITRWLIGQGRRQIYNVWMAPADRYWFAARRAGYERAMTEGGIAPLPTLLVPPRTIDMESHGRLWAGYLFELFQGPNAMDAVLLESDGNASEMAAVCRLFGKVPNVDVTIAGYDNYGSEMHDVPLVERPVVTVDKLNFCLGAEVVRLLLERAQGLLPEEPQLRKIAPRLVVNHPGRIESAAS